MSPETDLAFQAAVTRWADTEAIDPTRSPRAVCHGAYYVMYHAARAVLIAVYGTASSNHGRVESTFAEFARADGSDEAKQLSKLLRTVANQRTVADYTGEEIGLEHAHGSVVAAKAFLAFAARRLGLPTDIP